MQAIGVVLLGTFLAAFGQQAAARWHSVNHVFDKFDEPIALAGPGQSYVSARPDKGPWTAAYPLGNHFANVRDCTIRVYSAETVTFLDYIVASGHAGKSSHIVLRIELSEPIRQVTWDIGPHGRNVSTHARLVARASRDGSTWMDAHVYPTGQSADHDPPPARLSFDPPTSTLYIGWFADVPEGETGWWNLGSTGNLTFVPATTTTIATHAPSPSPTSRPIDEPLQGRRTIPPTFFGTTTHVNSEPSIHLLEDLGVNCVRLDFPWRGLEPSRRQYNVDENLWMIKSADLGLSRGLDQLVVLTTAPQWAMAERGTFPNDESVEALEAFMYHVAGKYRGRIRYWQAMNEPNMGAWKHRYVTFLKAFHRGVKRADPDNKVVLTAFAGVAPEHLEAAYRYGAKDYFDILAAHPYTRPQLPEDGGYVDQIKALRDVMRKHGDDKPLWVTEMGWNGVEPSMLGYLRSKFAGHRVYACTEEDQARGLARLYLISATIPWIERVYWFHLHQEAAYTEVKEPVDYYMGLFTPWLDGMIRPKDAYFAVKTVVAVLSNATYAERLELGPRIWALVFTRGKEATIALWCLDDGVTITLSDARAIKTVTSMVGTPVLVERNALPLSGRPFYVTCELAELERLKGQILRAGVQP
ncbi:MAG: hypothetical protein JXQ73_16075 [Phycisphaerae bacterium]|nr:hypothetical protein [Phycisphaerae bacterium]